MKTVWRFPLGKSPGLLGLSMPAGARVRSAAAQADEAVMWAEVDDGAPKEVRHFYLSATGDPLVAPEGRRLEFVATVVLRGGSNVLHVYEAKPY
jgi:hypothetical protein